MSSASLADVKARLSDYLKRCATEGPVVITRGGKPVAVLLAPQDEDELERLILAYSPRFQALLAKSRRSIRAGKGIPHEEFWKAVEARSRGTKRTSPKTGVKNGRRKHRTSADAE